MAEKKPKKDFAGEVKALDGLTEIMEKAYRKRMVQLRLDMKRLLEKTVGRD